MSWKRVCAIDEMNGATIKKFDVDGVAIVIAKIGDGFRAMPPFCPHMEEPLTESGVCDGHYMTCTKHLWQWDMRTGEPVGEAEKALLMYDVMEENNDILVNLQEELVYEYGEELEADDEDSLWD